MLSLTASSYIQVWYSFDKCWLVGNSDLCHQENLIPSRIHQSNSHNNVVLIKKKAPFNIFHCLAGWLTSFKDIKRRDKEVGANRWEVLPELIQLWGVKTTIQIVGARSLVGFMSWIFICFCEVYLAVLNAYFQSMLFESRTKKWGTWCRKKAIDDMMPFKAIPMLPFHL